MAKGQQRGNREVKKPKKDKAKTETTPSTFTSTMEKAREGFSKKK
jgi:hypothetical protein